jgi:hypothetical protein
VLDMLGGGVVGERSKPSPTIKKYILKSPKQTVNVFAMKTLAWFICFFGGGSCESEPLERGSDLAV